MQAQAGSDGHRAEARRRTAVRWTTTILASLTVAAAFIVSERGWAAGREFQAAPAPETGSKLIVYGDMTTFYGPGKPDNCILRSRFHRGESMGFRMFVADPQTGKREESAELVVHLSYAGKTLDLPMRYRATAAQPERQFWVAKWIVPETAPLGIVRYTVTARDSKGRTGEFKPFEVNDSQLTIVE
jgi:hypothetical protein